VPAAAASATSPAGPTAILEGPIGFVDGNPAPNGVAFEVPVGCRLIRTSDEYVAFNDMVSVRGTITPAEIVIQARPGYRYVVERKVLAQTMQRTQVEISAREIDAGGREIRRFFPVQNASELLADCKQREP
jgi:hypothetical protein